MPRDWRQSYLSDRLVQDDEYSCLVLLAVTIIPRSVDVGTRFDVDERCIIVEQHLKSAVVARDKVDNVSWWVTQQI